jgi:hypothetical protein
VFLARGAIEFLPLHENSTFPLLAEVWYLWALALDSAVAAQLVHWGLGVLLSGAAVLLAKPIVGHRSAWLAGVIVLAAPGVTNQMTAPLNDVALAAFTTLALVAWNVGRIGNPSYARRWFLLAGLMAGAALSVKYLALVFAAAISATWCLALLCRPGQRRRLLGGAAIVSGVAILVAGVWCVRAACHRGNPVYPFFSSLLGTEGPPTVRESKTPLKWAPRDLLTAPWQVTMHPDRFGGRGHQIGGLFLMVLPGAMLAAWRRVWTLLGIVAVYALLWYGLRQNVRFLFPVVPIMAAIAAAVLVELGRWPVAPRIIGLASCAAVVALGAMMPGYRARHHTAVAFGFESREQYLERCEPTYQAARFVNAHLPSDAHILSQDYRAFYFDRPVTRENAFRRVTAYPRHLADPAELVPLLRAAGFTHLLLAQADGAAVRYNGTLSRHMTAAQAADAGQQVTLLGYEFLEPDGSRRHYRLVELRERGTVPSEISYRTRGRFIHKRQ